MDEPSLPFVVTEDTDPTRTHNFEQPLAARARPIYTSRSFRILAKLYGILSAIAVALIISESIFRENGLLYFAAPFLLAASVSFLVFVYRSWNQLQEGETRANARESIGFLFVPLFNVYWSFIMFDGLPKQLNECLRAIGNEHRANEKIGTTLSLFAALFLLSIQSCAGNTELKDAAALDFTDPTTWIVPLFLLAMWGTSIAFVFNTARVEGDLGFRRLTITPPAAAAPGSRCTP